MAEQRIHFPEPGCIVEYMQGNKASPAWVLEAQTGAVRLFSAGGRESKLAPARILPWMGPRYSGEKSRQEMTDLLERHRARREELEAAINMGEVWELAQGEVQQVQAQWLAELLWVDPDPDQVAATAHAALAGKTHFKFSPPLFEIYDAEKVAARLAEQEKIRHREEFSVTGAEFFRALWDISCRRKAGLSPGDMPPPELRERLGAIVMERLADPDAHDHDGLWKLLCKGLPEEPHMPLRLAQAWGLVKEHHNFWMNRAGYDPSPDWALPFADDIAALAAISAGNAAMAGTVEDTPFVAVDAENTQDRDDALFVRQNPDGGFSVRMAFACPSMDWPFGSALDKTVLHRGASVYLPEGNCHMLPEAAGPALFSLDAGKTRPALLLDMTVAADGACTGIVPRTGRVRVREAVSFPTCQELLDGNTPASGCPLQAAQAHGPMLRDALALASILQARRIANGAVITERPDPELTLHEGADGEILVDIREGPVCPASHLLVSECMILANSALALWAMERGVPLIFRTQDVALPKEFSGVWTNPADIARIVKHLPPSLLEISPRPHAGVGVPAYTCVTSPLRRYTDLVNEAQIVHYLQNGAARLDATHLAALLPHVAAAQDLVGQMQRFRPRYWKLLYLKQQGEKIWWDAVVTEENDNFVTVSLSHAQLLVRAKRRLFAEKTYAGEPVQVRIGKVFPLLNEIQVLETREIGG